MSGFSVGRGRGRRTGSSAELRRSSAELRQRRLDVGLPPHVHRDAFDLRPLRVREAEGPEKASRLSRLRSSPTNTTRAPSRSLTTVTNHTRRWNDFASTRPA